MLGVAFLPPLLLMAAIGVFARGETTEWTDDPVGVARLPVHVGLVSNVGVVLWCVAATACLLGAAASRHRPDRRRRARFLLEAGALCALLLVDDLFLLHDRVLRLEVGVPKPVTLTVYGVLAAAVLVRHRDVLASRGVADHWLLGASLGGFAVWASVGAFTAPFTGHDFVRSTAKLLALAGWCTFLVRLAFDLLAGPEPAADPAPVAGG